MLAGALVERLREDLHDADGVRFPDDVLLGFLSDAQRTVVLCRPDANAVLRSVHLEAGSTRQALPSDGVRFLGVVRNMGADGTTPGRAVRLVDMDAMNASYASWHTLSGVEVRDCCPDESTPTVYWVSPVPGENQWVEIKFSANPDDLDNASDAISVFDTFAEALREYALYRAYARNDAVIDYQTRANLHLQRFYSLLGQDAQARYLSSPLMGISAAVQALKEGVSS